MNYCVSDVHGEYELFCRLLDKIKFGNADKLFVLGDMIDKGNNSIGLMKMLRVMPNVECIIGNHEYAFLKNFWGMCEEFGNDYDRILSMLQGYFPYENESLDWETISWLENLCYYVENDDFIGVHAGVPVDNGMIVNPATVYPEELVYDRHFKDRCDILQSEKCVIFGHTPVRYITEKDDIICYPKQGLRAPKSVKECMKIHIDTGAWLSDVLGLIDIDNFEAIYVKRG